MENGGLAGEVIVVGAGLAGIVTALELLATGKSVLLIDKDSEARFGGLAKESFGGVCLIGTPHQRRLGISDTPELAWRDWLSYAEFEEGDDWPRAWARHYCENSIELIFRFLDEHGVRFLPAVNWPERGLNGNGNSVPRWHIAWGTGFEIVTRLVSALRNHPSRDRLTLLFEHEVSDIDFQNRRVSGVSVRSIQGGQTFRADAERVVIASGGICGGDLSALRRNWYRPWGRPPEIILNGAHQYGDGMLHDRVAAAGGRVTHLDKQWHYAAGVNHPRKLRPHDGLSLVPPRSALWLNAFGKRIGPPPLIPYSDTRSLVERICQEPGQYSWQVMNWKIALRELAVSGCDYMTAFREKSRVGLLKSLIFGNRELVQRLIHECPQDIAVARALPDLAAEMDRRSLPGFSIDLASMEKGIRDYDQKIDLGRDYINDEQLRWILNFRTYRGDRLRTCKFQKILDPKALPLIAIREFILARKSLGGIQTDLACRVLDKSSEPIPGLYAVGEAAGFGGGGIHGLRSLEGTFLGGCVLTGRMAAQAIARG